MALYWGMRMYQTGLSSSQDKFSCSRKRSFVLISFMIWFWIGPPHEPTDCTGRVGRQPTELPFFSLMAGREREGGQWFQHALVGSRLYQSHWTAMLPFHIHAFSSGQNSRIVPWGRWHLHGLQEDRGWREILREVLRMKYICLSVIKSHDKPKPIADEGLGGLKTPKIGWHNMWTAPFHYKSSCRS